jgi:hypothetical protein
VAGFALGLFRLAVIRRSRSASAGMSAATTRSLLWVVNNIYFQHYGLLIFLVSVAAMVGVSLATAPPPERQLAGLTHATVSRAQRDASRRSWDWRRCRFGGRARPHRRHVRLLQRMTRMTLHPDARRQVHLRPLTVGNRGRDPFGVRPGAADPVTAVHRLAEIGAWA